MVAAFPLGKLLYLGIRQLSKPIALQLRNSAARHPFVSRYICAPPAQMLHRLELFVKMRIMGMKGKVVYQALSEERAVELGSEILGEMFLYTVAASYIVYEYWRSVKKEQKREEDQSHQILVLEQKTSRLESDVAGLRQIIQALEQSKAIRTQPVKSKSS